MYVCIIILTYRRVGYRIWTYPESCSHTKSGSDSESHASYCIFISVIVCMYVCMNVCFYVCMYVFIYLCDRMRYPYVYMSKKRTVYLLITTLLTCMPCYVWYASMYVCMYVSMYVIMIYMRIHAYIIDILRVVPRVRWAGRRCVRAWCARWSRRRSTPCTLAETHNTDIYYFTTYNEHTYIHTYM